MKHYLAMDIGGTTVKIGYLNDDGRVLEKAEYCVSFDAYETPIIQTVIKSTHDFLRDFKIAIQTLDGIAVSATGQIDSKSGCVIGVGGNIKNWLHTNIKDMLESEFHLPTSVMNDANCMVLAEAWMGSGKGCKNIVAITIGTGIGGGIVVDGNVLVGKEGCAAEIGHMSIAWDGKLCTCGNRGCYEQYASMSALIRMVEKRLLDAQETIGDDKLNGKYIFAEVARGNPLFLEVVDEWTSYIAHGAVNLLHTFNPELLIFGGGVSKQGEAFLQAIKNKILEKGMPNFTKNLEIKTASFYNDAGMIGALAYWKGMKQ